MEPGPREARSQPQRAPPVASQASPACARVWIRGPGGWSGEAPVRACQNTAAGALRPGRVWASDVLGLLPAFLRIPGDLPSEGEGPLCIPEGCFSL